MSTESKPFFVTLPGRGLIHIEGDDRHEFLQNLITNDIHALKDGACLYTCMLNPQGKFLFDFFIHGGDGFFLLDCEGGERAQKLYRHLNLYRLRSKVKISVEDQHSVYAVFDETTAGAVADPRHSDMGYRSFEKPAGLDEQPFEEWDKRRIQLGIPDGSRDMIVGKDTVLDCNIDRFHGVSFEKGCYVGQEITSRMHLRGLVKKHLHPVEINGTLPANGDDIFSDDEKLVGQMRSHCGHIGLALIREDAKDNLPAHMAMLR